jgi:hypothetical protein
MMDAFLSTSRGTMKLLKLGIRFWITLTSVVSFVGGWVLLAHAPKPDQQNSAYAVVAPRTIPTLEPLPPLSVGVAVQNDPPQRSWLNIFPVARAYRPAFRTGGS